jgi:hypothetical protein
MAKVELEEEFCEVRLYLILGSSPVACAVC